MEPLRVAAIGAGEVARWQLAAWGQVPGARLVAVCDTRRERAEAAAARFEIPAAYDDPAAMLRAETPDAVDVLAAPAAHRELALLAAAMRRPVLCQKPLAPNPEDGRAIVDGCRAAGVRLMVNENFRWRRAYRWARARLDEGALGRAFYASFTSRFAALADFAERWPAFRARERLLVLESTIHLIDVARFLFGEPERVYCQTERSSDGAAGEDVASLMLAFPGVTVVILHSWSSRGYPAFPVTEAEVAIEGTEGSIFVSSDGSARLVRADGSVLRSTYDCDYADYYLSSFVEAQRHFASCLATGEPFETGGEDNLRTLATALAAYESTDSGRAVPLAAAGTAAGAAPPSRRVGVD